MIATEATLSSSHSSEEIASGTALVEELLQAWAAATANLDEDQMRDEEDVVMGDGDAALPPALMKEYAPLKKCFDDFKERFDSNPWTRDVLSATY